MIKGKNFVRSFEKNKENRKMEGFHESNLILGSMVMSKKKNIRAAYLRRHKDNLIRLRVFC